MRNLLPRSDHGNSQAPRRSTFPARSRNCDAQTPSHHDATDRGDTTPGFAAHPAHRSAHTLGDHYWPARSPNATAAGARSDARTPAAGESPTRRGLCPYGEVTSNQFDVKACRPSLAAEVGPLGIAVNSLSPGPVAGARIRTVLKLEAKQRSLDVTAVEWPSFLVQSSATMGADALDETHRGWGLRTVKPFEAAVNSPGRELMVDDGAERACGPRFFPNTLHQPCQIRHTVRSATSPPTQTGG